MDEDLRDIIIILYALWMIFGGALSLLSIKIGLFWMIGAAIGAWGVFIYERLWS